MKKTLIFLFCTLSGFMLQAQPWMPEYNHKPVKLKDVIDNYKLHPMSPGEDEDKYEAGKPVKENGNYLFDRWVWYWQAHLDEQGYMISPVKTYEEWKKYQAAETATGTAQRTTATSPNWVFQGPDSTAGGYSGIGRINTIALHPTNPNFLIAGSAGGGAWKSTDGGHHWNCLYSNLQSSGVSDIVFNPQNPNTIYIATGDADGYGTTSIGIIKSTDSGTTWNATGLIWTSTDYIWVRSLIINPQDTNTLLAATRAGMYITHDAGVTWTSTFTGDFNQVIYKPGDTSIVYACKYPNGSEPASRILRSTNGGATWTSVTSFTEAQRINLAVCPASPSLVKALVSNNQSGLKGIYNSTNSGASFTPVYENDTDCTKNLLGYELGLPTSQCNGQGWYDLCIAINPTDPNKVIIGGVNNYYSTNGGVNWTIVTTWWGGITGVQTIHADKHCLKYNPIDLELYEGCDGGLYKVANPSSGYWFNIANGMGITQFYRNAVANGVPFCIGGAQDNGTKMMNAGLYTDLTGGDGMQCRIDYDNPSFSWYASSQNGNINRTIDGGASYINISSTIPDTLSGNWITPYIIHPLLSNVLMVGIDKLFISYDYGGSWTASSPVFHSGHKLSNIAMSPASNDYIYVEVDDNTLHFSPNFGVSWDTISTAGFSNTISCITVDPKNPDLLWVTFNGYGGGRVARYNRSTSSWYNYNIGLPDIPVNCIVIDSFSGTKYIGTDVAVYYMDTAANHWTLYNTNLPTVMVTDLNINYTTGELWAATYGRAMWKTMKREIPSGISVVPYAADVIKVAPNPNHGTFTINTTNKELTATAVSVRLITAAGKTAWQQGASFDNGGSLKISATGLAAGTYICEVINGQMIARCRVVIF